MARTRRSFLAASAVSLSGLAGSRRGRSPPACPAAVAEGADARLGFVGDVMLGRNVDDRWSAAEPAGVWGSMLDRLHALDGLFVNLECTLSTRGRRRPGRTYYFRADPSWAVPALEVAGVGFASLANNHLLDYGPLALADTTDSLSAAGIAHAGAGVDRAAAFDPAVASVGGLDVGVLALTDQSRSYRAGPDSSGTAWVPLDSRGTTARRLVADALDRLARRDPDVVVASLHWGPNWEVRPSADQRAVARWLVDRGVDVVHGHSAHVVQGVEVYRGRPIVYDAGDFVDDYVVKPELHNDRSFLFELVVADGRLDRLRLRPVEIVDERVEAASEEAAAWLRGRMRALSRPFGTVLERDGRGLVVPLARC